MIPILLCTLLAPLQSRDENRVLVIRNADSTASREIAAYYMERRGVKNVVDIHSADSAALPQNETISYRDFQSLVERPVLQYLSRHRNIDFLVLTKGVPIRIENAPDGDHGSRRRSLDSVLAAEGYEQMPDARRIVLNDSGFTGTAWANRFWRSKTPFSHERDGGYLVTRLDGYTVADAKKLVDSAIASERGDASGEVLLDTCPGFGYGGTDAQPIDLVPSGTMGPTVHTVNELDYKEYNADMVRAEAVLRERHIPVILDRDPAFKSGAGLMGYISWGSNDQHYDAGAYHKITFAPGAIAETAVSTSARTFLPTSGGQSLVADLVAQGVTGVKGYTDEPLLQAIASPTVLFYRYTEGWTLAESFSAASRFLGWEDIVIGDPICRPYRRAR